MLTGGLFYEFFLLENNVSLRQWWGLFSYELLVDSSGSFLWWVRQWLGGL